VEERSKAFSAVVAGTGIAVLAVMLAYYGSTFRTWDIPPENLGRIRSAWNTGSLILHITAALMFLTVRYARLDRILSPPPKAISNTLAMAALLSFFLVAFATIGKNQPGYAARVDGKNLQIRRHAVWVSVGADEFDANGRRNIRKSVAAAMTGLAVNLIMLSANGKKIHPKTYFPRHSSSG
jgi:hypothetical protein